MTLTEWRDHLEILGPDLSVWPQRLAEAGLDLMSTSEAAQDVFVEASGGSGETSVSDERHRLERRPRPAR